jgi:PhnB protein
MTVSPVPAGYHTVTPYLIVRGAARAIEYYQQAFGAILLMRLGGSDEPVVHAELMIGDSRIMLADEHPDMGALGPESVGGTPVLICLYVPNVDEVIQKAIQAGGTVERPVQDQFYGDRSGSIVDPFGHRWTISTHIEDLSAEEIQRRMSELY